MISVCSHSLGFTPFCSQWIVDSPRLSVVGATANSQGVIEVFECCKGKLISSTKVLKPSAFRCGTEGPRSMSVRNLVTGCFSGSLQVWDYENLTNPIYDVRDAHAGTVNSVFGAGGDRLAPEIVSGGRDGSVKIWDCRQPEKAVAVFKPDTPGPDCWTVTMGNRENYDRIVAAGFNNGDIRLFDLRKMGVVAETSIGSGVCSLDFDPSASKLLATGMESRIHYFDLHDIETLMTCSKISWNKSTVWSGKHLPQNSSLFAVTSGNGCVALWKSRMPRKIHKNGDETASLQLLTETPVSDQPVTSLSWNPNKKGLAALTSFNETVQVVMFTKFD